jgi:hypothetical protein
VKSFCSLPLLPFLHVDDLFAGIAKLSVLLAQASKHAAPAGRRSSAEFVVIAFAGRALFCSEATMSAATSKIVRIVKSLLG